MTKTKWFIWLAPRLGAILYWLLSATVRCRIEDRAGVLLRTGLEGPVIFTFWHGRIFMLPYLYRKHFPERTMSVMVSRSRDGQIAAELVKKLGIHCTRGSTSKNSVGVFLNILKELREHGHDLAITPDGPRGPRGKAHPGVFHLAALSGRPIVPITYELSWKWTLRSWDRMQIPFPLSCCRVVLHPPILIPEESKDDISPYQARLEEILGKC